MRTTGVPSFAIALLASVSAAVALAGCGGGDETTKAGGSGAPLTLRIGTNDRQGLPGSEQIEEFARRVEELSGGTIRIEPVWDTGDDESSGWDQEVARMVMRGDMGSIPARTWDTEGVMSLRALHAPFLVASDALLDEIVVSDLAAEMLAGLDEAGVVGLALLPEGLRHPFAFGTPMLSLEDYARALIRVPRSEVSYAVFEALGATPDDLVGPPENRFERAVADGEVQAAESAFVVSTWLPSATIATGNVTFFPKANTLVVNAKVFASLSPEQQRVLEQSAARTVTWAVDSMPTDAEAARLYCERGDTVVLASDADPDLAALEQAAAPVYDELERDPETKALIAAIRELQSGLAAPAANVPAPCGTSGGQSQADGAGREDDPSVLNGVYRSELTYEYLVENGVDEARARQDSGVQTMTLANARWVVRWPNAEWSGTYAVDGDLVTFTCTAGCDGGATARYALHGETLSWSDVRVLPPLDSPYEQHVADVEWALPMERIG